MAPVALEGSTSSWSAARATLALSGAAPVRGPRFARRAVASARRVVVTLGPATVIVLEDVENLPDDPPFDEEPEIDPDDPYLGDEGPEA